MSSFDSQFESNDDVIICNDDYDELIGEDAFIFACDYDTVNKRWWFRLFGKKKLLFYINSDPLPYNYIGDGIVQELIDTQLKPKYPQYNIYSFIVEPNTQTYDEKTKSYSPSYHFTITINYRYFKN